MKELLIFGSGGHSRVAISVANTIGLYTVSYVVDTQTAPSKPTEYILGVPVISVSQAIEHAKASGANVFVAIGDNKARKAMHLSLMNLGFEIPALVHPSAILCEECTVGCGCLISANSHIGPEVIVGQSTIINTMANIEHESIVGDYCHVGPNSTVCGRVTIGSSVLIGASSTILPHVSISDNIVLGAGSLVVRDLDCSGQCYFGSPAVLR